MSAIELRKILLLSVLLVVVILYPLTTFAMVATSSDAKELPVSTFSNALPSQDYMESDDFDTLEIVMLILQRGILTLPRNIMMHILILFSSLVIGILI